MSLFPTPDHPVPDAWPDETDSPVVHRPELSCFEIVLNGERCELDYELRGQVMRITYTGVPRSLEGRGLAARLVEAALEHAQAQEWRVVPLCNYVEAYMRRHPETAELRLDR